MAPILHLECQASFTYMQYKLINITRVKDVVVWSKTLANTALIEKVLAY